jgi:hypothetical protein
VKTSPRPAAAGISQNERVQVAMLGPVEVRDSAGSPREVSGTRPRALLSPADYGAAFDRGREVTLATVEAALEALLGPGPAARGSRSEVT